MQRFARWTNLSETTFLLPPAQRRGRLPRAHLHARRRTAVRRAIPRWAAAHCLAGGGRRAAKQRVHRAGMPGRPGAAAPRRRRAWPSRRRRCSAASPVAEVVAQVARRARACRRSQVLGGAEPGQRPGLAGAVARQPGHRARPRARPPGARAAGPQGRRRGAVHAGPAAGPHLEVRAFAAPIGITEDPVTGSLNASLAQWLIDDGRVAGALPGGAGRAPGPRGAHPHRARRRAARSGWAATPSPAFPAR